MRGLIFAIVWMGLLPDAALGATIGLYRDAAGTDCNGLALPIGGSATLYVVASTGASGGITGAEFRIEGLPAGAYETQTTSNPAANVAAGDPFGAGCTIAFPSCQDPPGRQVLLYTVTLFNVSDGEDRVLLVVHRDPPSNPASPCPLLWRCDDPVFTPVCVPSWQIGLVRSRPGEPRTPVPANGATEVPVDVRLNWEVRPFWCCTLGGLYQNVRFGKTPEPPIVAYDSGAPFDPGRLESNTTYYWSITSYWSGCFAVDGPVWSFKTGTQVGVEEHTWSGMKELFQSPSRPRRRSASP